MGKNKKTVEKVKKITIGAADSKIKTEQGKLDKLLKDQAKAVDTVKQGDKKSSHTLYFNLATAKCEHFQATIQNMLTDKTFFDDKEDAVTKIKEAAIACADAILQMRYDDDFSIEDYNMDMPAKNKTQKKAEAQKVAEPNKTDGAKTGDKKLEELAEWAKKKKGENTQEKADSKQAKADSTSYVEVLFANLHADNRYKWNL